MKTVIAIVRHDRIGHSVASLREIGVACMAVPGARRYGRRTADAGMQDLYFSRHRRPRSLLPHEAAAPSRRPGRRGEKPVRTGMLVMFAADDSVPAIVRAIIPEGTGRSGDGEVYVCPMVAALDP